MLEAYPERVEPIIEDFVVEVMDELPVHEQLTDSASTVAKYVEEKYGGNE